MPGRIPNSFIQELLARTDIVELIGARLDLKRRGREYVALSPFTNEKTPSFYVSPAKQFFHDFSSGRHGNAIGFLMEHDRMAFPDAVEELARRAGLTVPREGGVAEPADALDGLYEALAEADRVFRAQLRKAPEAVAYLKQRGVTGETAKAFGIGYAPDAADTLAAHFRDPAPAVAAGLLVPSSRGGAPFDRFRQRVMFPIRDTRGRITGFGGRTLGNHPAKYLNSPETPVFHKGRQVFGLYEARQSSKSALASVFVVEGYMDVVMLAQHGIRNVVATLGTATTSEQLALLFKTTSRVVFCFDGDRAGRDAAWRALERALPEMQEQRECRFMFLPEGHDPDTLVQAEGAEAFLARAAAAVPLTEFLLAELKKQTDLASLDGRARLAGLARPHLARLRPGPLREVLIEELSRLTRLPAERFEGRYAGDRPAEPPARPGEAATAASAPFRTTRTVRWALQLLLEEPVLAQGVQDLELLAQAPDSGVGLLVEVLEFFLDRPHSTAAQLLEEWRDHPQAGGLARLAAAENAPDEDGIRREFSLAIKELNRRSLQRQIDAVLQEAEAGEFSPALKAAHADLIRRKRQL